MVYFQFIIPLFPDHMRHAHHVDNPRSVIAAYERGVSKYFDDPAVSRQYRKSRTCDCEDCTQHKKQRYHDKGFV